MGAMHPVCRQIRKDILRASHRSGHGHIPSCFSVVELLYATYGSMRHDPARPELPERDLFVLSKGHASLSLYCVLARLGYFPFESVESFGAYRSRFGCHPDRFKVPGIEASTGSLGHGMPLAAGMALAQRILGSPRRVFTLIGDGEANEGTIWETLMVASYQRLSNLTVLFDHNRSQSRSLPIAQPREKFESFGCHVFEVDGHDVDALESALRAPTDRVRVVLAATEKGHGCRRLVDEVFEWHRRAPDAAQLDALLAELDA